MAENSKQSRKIRERFFETRPNCSEQELGSNSQFKKGYVKCKKKKGYIHVPQACTHCRAK